MRGLVILILAVLIGAFVYYYVDFDVNDLGALPTVSVEGGRAPDVDVNVNAPQVDVTTEERTVTVPKIEVTPPAGTD